MNINIEFIKPLLKNRFTPIGVFVEGAILDALGAHYYKGDRVTWEHHRRAGYAMHHKGCSVREIASKHKIPVWIAEWWMSIWEMYDGAWSPKKYN